MYTHSLHQQFNQLVFNSTLDIKGLDNNFYMRGIANLEAIATLFFELYPKTEQSQAIFIEVLQTILQAHQERPSAMRARDAVKADIGNWFLSNQLTGMSLYVDRFCGKLKNLPGKLSYLQDLGINLLHFMPLFESPEKESDGGYAVSNFRQVDKRFGTAQDLATLQKKLADEDMYLMLDIVLNHTSNQHVWAQKARAGDTHYQSYYYMYPDRKMPDEFDKTMPEIFPESAPGSFTYVPECDKWVMTVFHNYQWDLNYRNPLVFKEMLGNILFFANLGVDILRVDAPVFLWKELGTTCQNLPQVHTILRLIKQCVQVSAPGMAILSEAIVAPREVMKHFGTESYTARECDFAYNAAQMALQWDMLATSDTRVMRAAQPVLLQKPLGTSWINYTRCHDDIGLAFEDDSIVQAGFGPVEHRKFLKDYYSGKFPTSPAKGALFSFNPKTGDARISGSLASLCGLEKAIEDADENAKQLSIQKVLLMQAHCFFLGGIPMVFYGDEIGYTNDYSYLNDPGKSYDNRWMHRPIIDWKKNALGKKKGTVEHAVFQGTKKLIDLRKTLPAVADLKNLAWLDAGDKRIACFTRFIPTQQLYCIFNFSPDTVALAPNFLNQIESKPTCLNHWTGDSIAQQKLTSIQLAPYEFQILEWRS
jgi:amylosucrase